MPTVLIITVRRVSNPNGEIWYNDNEVETRHERERERERER